MTISETTTPAMNVDDVNELGVWPPRTAKNGSHDRCSAIQRNVPMIRGCRKNTPHRP